MGRNSIMFDIDDPRSGKIADVMSNKTAKKILNVLAGGEKSASDVAAELGAPLNTITYNLDKLVSAGLVEKSKRFFWSSKGKRMEFYRVANKRIVISPKSFNRKVAPIVAIFLVMIVAAVLIIVNNNSEKTISDGGLKKFSSVDEMKAFLEQGGDNYGGDYNKGIATEFATADSVGASNVAGASARSSGGASDYSTTNIQVEGVDEPDIVKNDGKYIYAVSGKKVSIIEAFPAEEMKLLKNLEFNDYVNNIFLNEEKLIVFMNHYEYFEGGGCPTPFYGGAEIGIRAPCYGGYSKEETKIVIYDVGDKENPEVVKEFSVSGNYIDARMINDYVYLISTKYINLNNFELPYYYADEKIVIQPNEIRYFDYSDNSYVFNTISAVDLDNEEINTEVFMLGGSQTIYVSKDNIYLTMRKSLSQKEQIENYVEQVVLKILPTSEADKVREIMNSDEKLHIKNREAQEVLQDYIDELEGQAKIEFLNRFSEVSEDYYKKLNEELDKTVVHKIGLDEMNIEYAGGGEVSGSVLNQFSMDESDGYFRIATTSGQFRRESENNLYVLNDELEIVGSVEGLAEGERIYSTRFLGERAYMVTFKQVDPLFVIDLSVPSEPRVLGYLKVTGYSSYLHPYDENHIIGVGQEATEEGRVQGVKISLFDVSDVANPREIGKYEVTEGQYSYSDAISDHKAFLFDKEKELLVMPVSYNSYDSGRYEYWQGAFVFNVNLDDGIKLKGKIAHDRKDVEQYYYGGQDYVRRSLFMDDVLYTVSNAKVKANALNDLSEIEEVELPYEP